MDTLMKLLDDIEADSNKKNPLLRLCKAIERHNDLYAAELKVTLEIEEHRKD